MWGKTMKRIFLLVCAMSVMLLAENTKNCHKEIFEFWLWQGCSRLCYVA